MNLFARLQRLAAEASPPPAVAIKACLPHECFIVEKQGQLFFVDANADRAARIAVEAMAEVVTKQVAPPEDLTDWLVVVAKILDTAQAPDPIPIIKVDEDQHVVTGWASIIADQHGAPVVDFQGDMIDETELVSAAHSFMMDSRQAGELHKRLTGVGQVVDSLVVTKALKEALGLPANMPTGWLVSVKVSDPGVWAKIKAGEYKSFSIGGSAIREPVA